MSYPSLVICALISPSPVPHSAENTYKLEQELANIDNVSAAAAHTRAAQLAERDHYDAVMASSDVNLERARQEIAEAKDKLAKAKAVRARKEEYAHVLGQIGQQQARSRSQQLIAQLEQELVALEGEHAAGAAELDLRRRQLALLLHALTVSVETEANDPAIALAAAGRGSQEPDGQL